ncbi:LCP family protein [Halalkalibacterium ligniniphilum]|uniref:LCP family protein n=1 Tax=Halalkalibacterium ligniniphilum TaxID=1134413 RepID=UPI00055631E6|nr:LCP family protein [Halalkalibacterium ligniniphilum]
MTNSRVQRRKSRLRRILRAFLVVGIVSFIAFGGAAGYFIYKLANVTSGAQQELARGDMSEKREEQVNPSKDNISILFLGVDDRDGNLSGRTDAILVATFNKEDTSVNILSIPRDSLVNIPGRTNPDKINHAHAYGGLDLSVSTVEELLDIPIDYYVKLNFDAFVEIIDALGGVEVDVPKTFSEQDSSGNQGAITLQEGTHTLNGEEALAFVRMRKADPLGDIGRGHRQQQVIKAIIEKGSSISSITSYDDVLESVGTHMTTNLSFGNMVALHSYGRSLNEVNTINIESSPTSINGVSYVQLDEASLAEVTHALRVHLGLEEASESKLGTTDAASEADDGTDTNTTY